MYGPCIREAEKQAIVFVVMFVPFRDHLSGKNDRLDLPCPDLPLEHPADSMPTEENSPTFHAGSSLVFLCSTGL
jgi:hypothetical protein